METNKSMRRCPSLASQDDDDDLWKMGSKLIAENTERANSNLLSVPGEGHKSEHNAHHTAVIQNDAMKNEGADLKFIPLRPCLSNVDPLLPGGNNKDTATCNSSVTLVCESGDDTEAKANPISLDWHHSERQSMEAQRESGDVSAGTAQISGEFKDLTPNVADQIPKDPLRGTKGGSYVQVETWCEADEGTFPKQASSEAVDKFEDEAHLGKVGDKIQRDFVKPFKASKENGMTFMQQCNLREFFTNKENMTTSAHSHPKAQRPAEAVDADSKDSLLESNKGTCGEQILKKTSGKVCSNPSDERQSKVGKGKHRDEFWRIASDILQGERLLQRLQLVQQRQEADMRTCQEVSHEREHEEVLTEHLAAIEGGPLGESEKEEIRFHTINSDKPKTSLLEREKTEGNGSGKAQEKMPAQPEHRDITTRETDCSDDTQSVSYMRPDWIPVNSNETISSSTSLRSNYHRFSVTETSIEKRIHEVAQGKQNLQRTEGILNLADDPDVLEIPFKTNIAFELIPTKTCPAQESKPQKVLQEEVSQESQRRLGTNRQGDISKEYGRREAHQLKKTKLPFEAFQQDNTQGPTRLRKPLSSSMTDQVHPTVLERTCSLVMFSTSERKKSSENLHSKIPTGGSRDRTRLSPYPKQDKNVRLCRSSDYISTDVSKQVVENSLVSKDKVGQEAPVPKQNPFFKLRPALALKPEVEEDIREAEAREDEIRNQRRTLYGEKRLNTEEGDTPPSTSTVTPGIKPQSRGKLERVWPPPCKKEQLKSELTQGPSVHRAGSQRSHLWQRWEFGQINGQSSAEKK
ncbi:uncharacterized protein LOC144003448 [Festucalex cinctus]